MQAEAVSRAGGRPFALVWSPIPIISWLMPFIGHIGVCSSAGHTYDFAGPFTVNEDELLFGKPARYLQLNPTHVTKGARRGAASLSTRTDDGDAELGFGLDMVNVTASGRVTDTSLPGAPSSAVGGDNGATVGAGGGGGSKTGSRASGQGSFAQVRLGTDGSGGSKAATAAPASTSAAVHSWDHRLSFAATTYRMLNYNIMTNNCHCFVAHFLNQIGYQGGGWDMVNLAALMFIRGRYSSLAALIYTWLPWLLLVAVGGYLGQLLFLYGYLAVCAPLLAWFLSYTWCCWRDLSF